MTTTFRLLELPDELLSRVVELVPFLSGASSLALTNKRLARLARPQLWAVHTFICDRKEVKEDTAYLVAHPELHSYVRSVDWCDFSFLAFALLPTFVNLRELHIRRDYCEVCMEDHSHVDRKLPANMASLLSRLPQLAALALTGFDGTQTGFAWSEMLPSLRSLSLFDSWIPTSGLHGPDSLTHLSTYPEVQQPILDALPYIRSLTLYPWSSVDALSSLVEKIEAHSSLKVSAAAFLDPFSR